MSDLFFWITVYSKVINFFWVIFGVSLFLSIGVSLFWFLYNLFYEIDVEKKDNQHYAKYVIIGLSLFLFSVIFQSVKPTKQEIITHYILSRVDDYNIEHEGSSFNPENILENVDDILIKVKEVTNKILDKGLEE